MPRIKFGGFVAPHHPIGENPTLQLQRDLDLAAHLDRLGLRCRARGWAELSWVARERC